MYPISLRIRLEYPRRTSNRSGDFLTELNCACKFKVFSPRTGDALLIFTKTIPSRRLAAVLLGVLFGAASFGFSEVPQKQQRPPAEEARRPVSVDTRVQLFATVCALDAAGFESTVNPAGQSPGRAQLRQRMLALQGPAVETLRMF